MKTLLSLILLLACLLGAAQARQLHDGAYTSGTKLQPGVQHQLFLFPDFVSQPDGMDMDKQGNIYVSSPNFNNQKYPGTLLRITPDYKWSVFYNLPVSDKTKKAGPMGLAFGPDGNLYIADNQYYYNKDFSSRILRLNMKNGQPTGVDVVVKGLKHPNAVRWHGDHLYITDTKWSTADTAKTSGIFKIALNEMQHDSVMIQPTMQEQHLLATFRAIEQPNGKAFGTDGMDFDSKGNLFVGMFSDGRVFKLTFNPDGSVKSKDVFLSYGTIPCCDGLFIDKKTDNLYIADSQQNAIHIVTPDAKVHTLAQNGNTTGADGKMDQPCEPLLVGDKLIVANYDQPNDNFVNERTDEVHNMTIIQVPQQYLAKQAGK
ncbi:SMP-30/gluconolactonase/LRE family protein [Pontibacter chitinilyticus]|uniref:SMP-30/gluconolactonase/LRE family protein n=1 Tax=Pontibacter chitinilyticus TaxID=2674989 RepID=UPI00321B4862